MISNTNFFQSPSNKSPKMFGKTEKESLKPNTSEIYFKLFELKNTGKLKIANKQAIRKIENLFVTCKKHEEIPCAETRMLKTNDTYLWAGKLILEEHEMLNLKELKFTLKVEQKNMGNQVEILHKKIEASIESFKAQEFNCVMMMLIDDDLDYKFVFDSDINFFDNLEINNFNEIKKIKLNECHDDYVIDNSDNSSNEIESIDSCIINSSQLDNWNCTLSSEFIDDEKEDSDNDLSNINYEENENEFPEEFKTIRESFLKSEVCFSNLILQTLDLKLDRPNAVYLNTLKGNYKNTFIEN